MQVYKYSDSNQKSPTINYVKNMNNHLHSVYDYYNITDHSSVTGMSKTRAITLVIKVIP